MFNRQSSIGKRDEPAPVRPNTLDGRPQPANGVKPGTPATPGSTPGAVAGKPAEGSDKSKADTVTGSRLIVGPDVKLKGAEILDCDTLVVEGRVEATMDSRVLHIAEHGSFSGKVGIDVAEIHGNFEGELTVRSQLLIHSTGRVSGKIRYGKILIDEGGQISGDVQSITGDDSNVMSLSNVVKTPDAERKLSHDTGLERARIG